MPTAAAWPERLLRKSDAVALQQIKERGVYLWLNVVISVRQSTVAAISASLPGAGYGQFEHVRLDSRLQNSKKGGTVRDWCMSRVIAIISAWLSASSACHVNHYRDNAITYKAQREQKCQRTEAGERGNIDMQMRQRDVAAPDAKIHEGVSWC